MSKDRANRNNDRHGRNPSWERDTGRSKHKRRGGKSKSQDQRSWSRERNPGRSHYNGQYQYGPNPRNYDFDVPAWSFQSPLGFNPMMGPPSHSEFGSMFMGNRPQISGPVFNPFAPNHMFSNNQRNNGDDYHAGYHGEPAGRKSNYREDVLEKAENMVNELAEKRKQATQPRSMNKKSPVLASAIGKGTVPPRGGEFSPRRSDLSPRRRSDFSSRRKNEYSDVGKSLSADSSPRLNLERWSGLAKDYVGELPSKDNVCELPSSPSRTKNDVVTSPGTTRVSAKVDVSKVAGKSDSLTRSSIAKLINAPRSQKEKQKLASLVKKTKPKPLRPKLDVQAVPEVGVQSGTDSPGDSVEMLDLVELPDNLRRQVESLLEHGPDTTLMDVGSRSPAKSPVSKKAKTDDAVDNRALDKSAEISSVRLERGLNLSDLDTSYDMKQNLAWDSESVVSDVTSVGHSEDGRRPFNRLADRITSDPKLNDILSNKTAKKRSESPKEDDLLDSRTVEAMVHEALGESPRESSNRSEPESNFKIPGDPVRQRSSVSKSSSHSQTISSHSVVHSSHGGQQQSIQVPRNIATEKEFNSAVNHSSSCHVDSSKRAKPSIDSKTSSQVDHHVSMNSGDDKKMTVQDLIGTSENAHSLEVASKALSLAKSQLRDTSDSLLSLHLAIHNPSVNADTVNFVLDITEREENLNDNLQKIDDHSETLVYLINESQKELDKLFRLREEMRKDGEILRKQRLDALRNAVSKKKSDNDVQSAPVEVQSVTSSSESLTQLSETTDSGESAEITPRNQESSRNGKNDDSTVMYMGTISMGLRQQQALWESLQKSSDLRSFSPSEQESIETDTVSDGGQILSRAVDPSLDNDGFPLLDGETVDQDEVDPGSAYRNLLKRKAKQLGVKKSIQKSKSKNKSDLPVPSTLSKKKKRKNNKSDSIKRKFMQMCREIGNTTGSEKSVNRMKSGSEIEQGSNYGLSSSNVSESEASEMNRPTSTDVTNDESELDCPEKVKVRLLKYVDKSEYKEKARSDQKKANLKVQLLKSLTSDEKFSTREAPIRIPDAVVQSTMLDHEIAVKLQQCSSALQELQENKLKQAQKKVQIIGDMKTPVNAVIDLTNTPNHFDSSTSNTFCPDTATAKIREVISDIDLSSTSSKDSVKKRKSRRHRKDKIQFSSSDSEFDSDKPHSVPKKIAPVFASDSRKDRLRQMGVILSASELEEFCKDGHNLSDRESCSEIVTARTEDLLIQTPRSDLDTARTEDLMRPIQSMMVPCTSSTATPVDDSDAYSSCVESIDPSALRGLESTGDLFTFQFRRLDSTGESLNYRPESQNDSGNDIPQLSLPGYSLEDDHTANRASEPRVTIDALNSERSGTSEDLSERYKEKIVEMLEDSSDTDLQLKRERHDSTDDVTIFDEIAFLPPSNPPSARSVHSVPSYGHKRLKFPGHTSAVTCIVLHENFMFTSSLHDSLIRKFDLDSGVCLSILRATSDDICPMEIVEFQGKLYLFAGDYKRKLVKYDVETQECLTTYDLSADIRCIVAKWNTVFIGLRSGEITIINLELNSLRQIVDSGKSVSCMDTGVEGARHVIVVGTFDSLISVHDASNGLLLRTISSHTRVPTCLKVSLGVVYSAGADKCIKQHDLYSGDQLRSVQIAHEITDLALDGNFIYVACFDGIIRCYNKELELKSLYYGAGRHSLLRLCVKNCRLYSSNKDGYVESSPISDKVIMCPCKNCRLGFGLIGDLEYHVTERHIESRVEDGAPVFFCSWIGCCFETRKRMDLENHLLNHMENLANDETNDS